MVAGSSPAFPEERLFPKNEVELFLNLKYIPPMKIQYQDQHLLLFESDLYRTTTTLIRTADYSLLVDPNLLPREIDFIYREAARNWKGGERYILFTHSDYDHIIGYGKFATEWQVIASKNFAANPDKEDALRQILAFDEEYYIRRNYPIRYPDVDIAIADEEEKQLGEHLYLFCQGTGHNRDGLFAFNLTLGILIAGDYLSNIEFPYIYESVAAYEQTLDRLERTIRDEKVNLLITGHGDHTTDREEMITRVAESKAYIDQLKAAVRTGKPFNTAALWEQYDFPRSMAAFHEENMALAKKEL